MKNQPGTMKNHEKQPRTMNDQPGTMKNLENRPGTMKNQPSLSKNVTDAGSQLTFEMGEGGGAGITEKRH